VLKNCTELDPDCGSCSLENPTYCTSCLTDFKKVHKGMCVMKSCTELYNNCQTCDENDESKCSTCILNAE